MKRRVLAGVLTISVIVAMGGFSYAAETEQSIITEESGTEEVPVFSVETELAAGAGAAEGMTEHVSDETQTDHVTEETQTEYVSGEIQTEAEIGVPDGEGQTEESEIEIIIEETQILGESIEEVPEEDIVHETEIYAEDKSIAPLLASGNQCGANLYWELNEGVLKIYGTGAMSESYIDENGEEVEGYPWDDDWEKITSIVLEEGITTIGESAFTYCYHVKGELKLPSTLTEIGGYAFMDLEGLTGDLVIPDHVTQIGDSAFENCSGLTGTLTIGENVKRIGEWAFLECGFTGTVVLGKQVKTVLPSAFECPSLSEIKVYNEDCVLREAAIGAGITIYGYEGSTAQNYARENGNPFILLDQYVLFPENDEENFEYDPKTEGYDLSIVFMNDVKLGTGSIKIFDYVTDALYKQLPINDGNVTLEKYIGQEVDGGKYILNIHADKIPPNCKVYVQIEPTAILVDDEEFDQIQGLEGWYFTTDNERCGKNLTWKADDTGCLTIEGNGEMWDFACPATDPYVVVEKPESGTYGKAPWHQEEVYDVKISGGSSIGKYAFASMPLSSLTLGKSLLQIKEYAFSDAGSLNIIWNDQLEMIGDFAFEKCNLGTREILPKQLKEIGEGAFSNCSVLLNIVLQENVKRIGKHAFKGCEQLQTAYFCGDAPREFGENVFDGSEDNFYIHSIRGKKGWTTPKWNGYRVFSDYFLMWRDNSHFRNAEDSFLNGNEQKGYPTSSKYDKLLAAYGKEHRLNYLNVIYERDFDTWGGSCFGIVCSMIAKYKGIIQDISSFGGYGDYYDLAAPRTNHELRDLIHYYQLAQKLELEKTISIKNNADSQKRKAFWRDFVHEVKMSSDQKMPILLNYLYKRGDSKKRGGHLMLVSGYNTAEESNGKVILEVYDVNDGTEDDGEHLVFRYVTVDLNNGTFDYEDAEGNQVGSVWEKLEYYRSSQLKNVLGTANHDVMPDGKIAKPYLLAPYDSSFKIRDEQGRYLIWNNGTYDSNVSDVQVRESAAYYGGAQENVIISWGTGSKFWIENSTNGFYGVQFQNGETYGVGVKGTETLMFHEGAGILAKGSSNEVDVLMTNSRMFEADAAKIYRIHVKSDSDTYIGIDNNGVKLECDGTIQSAEGNLVENGDEQPLYFEKTEQGYSGTTHRHTYLFSVFNWNKTISATATFTCACGAKQTIPCRITSKRINATCMTAGSIVHTAACTYNGEIYSNQKATALAVLGHVWSAWTTSANATVFEPEFQQRTCSRCKKTEARQIGSKCTPTISVNVSKIPLKTKQSTKAVKVSGLAPGDSVAFWSSSNTKIVKVTSSGKITAQKKKGKATVTVQLASGLKKKITVNVQNGAVKTTKISGIPKKMSLRAKWSLQLHPTVTPITSLQKVTYKTSNKKVATVSKKGKVTAKKKGKAVITIRSGNKSVKCKITVK